MTDPDTADEQVIREEQEVELEANTGTGTHPTRTTASDLGNGTQDRLITVGPPPE